MKSTLGKGTAFSFEIPMEFSKEVIEVKEENFSTKTKDLDLSKLQILVVEDNKINQMITKKILNKMGLTCQVVDNGEEAVDKVKNEDFAIVLMDIHMPGISGIETTKRIRDFDMETPIVALTAIALDDNLDEFYSNGFNDIIPKPYKTEEFFFKLHRAFTEQKKKV